MMRHTTDFTALRTAPTGSGDSAAAIVAISAPKNEKTTTKTAENIGATPCGANPPWPVRLASPGESTPGKSPKITAAPSRTNTVIAATLIEANQNSNSPYDFTENKFVPVRTAINTNTHAHCGNAGIQRCTMAAPAVASTPIVVTQNHQ